MVAMWRQALDKLQQRRWLHGREGENSVPRRPVLRALARSDERQAAWRCSTTDDSSGSVAALVPSECQRHAVSSDGVPSNVTGGGVRGKLKRVPSS
jgi:hypothetical protein